MLATPDSRSRLRPGARAVCRALVLALLVGVCPAACRSHSETTPEPAPSASAKPAPVASASAQPKPAKPQGFMVPGGPRLAILAGKGVGTIRIGATVETIERHMERKCDLLTDQVCRYVARAVEFELDGGKVRAVRVHRPQRPSGVKDANGEERLYGIFNGMIPPDVQFGMTVPGVQVALGKPKRTEKVDDERFGTVELHHYAGMILEYDRVRGSEPVLGGVRIVPR
jgi:hypothetical protein